MALGTCEGSRLREVMAFASLGSLGCIVQTCKQVNPIVPQCRCVQVYCGLLRFRGHVRLSRLQVAIRASCVRLVWCTIYSERH